MSGPPNYRERVAFLIVAEEYLEPPPLAALLGLLPAWRGVIDFISTGSAIMRLEATGPGRGLQAAIVAWAAPYPFRDAWIDDAALVTLVTAVRYPEAPRGWYMRPVYADMFPQPLARFGDESLDAYSNRNGRAMRKQHKATGAARGSEELMARWVLRHFWCGEAWEAVAGSTAEAARRSAARFLERTGLTTPGTVATTVVKKPENALECATWQQCAAVARLSPKPLSGKG